MAGDADPPPATDEPLPVPVDGTDAIEPRPYLELRPADAPVDPRAITHAMESVEAMLRAATQRRLRDKLTRSTAHPAVEWLLVSDGHPDPIVTPLVGCSDPDLLGELEAALRTGLPAGYELRDIEYHPWALVDHCPDHAGPDNPAITASQPYVAGVEYRGAADYKHDWMTGLTAIDAFADGSRLAGSDAGASGRVPLAALLETMRAAELPVAYQVVARPFRDWTDRAEGYIHELETGTVGAGAKLWDAVDPREREEIRRYEPPPADARRIESLTSRDPARTFVVTARAVVLTRTAADRADTVARRLATDLSTLGGRFHTIAARVATDGELHADALPPGTAIYADLLASRTARPAYGGLDDRLKRTRDDSPAIVATPAELAGFWLPDGARLTPDGQRAVAPRPGERTAVKRPPVDQLAPYRCPGLTIGTPLTADGTTDGEPVAVPPSLQPLHAAWFGKTGSGKSTSLVAAILDNHAATDGADILHAPKGGGMATGYLKAHYARFGDLEDVLYFDCAELLPAFSFFDVRSELAAGVPRTTAVEDRVDHYIAILRQVMGADRYEQAVRAPDVIRYLVKALFDPVNGEDAFAHRDLHEAARIMHEREAPPPISDADLEAALAGVVANRSRTFDEIMGAVMNRIEKVPVDRRLARVFNHVPATGDAHFDLAEYLDEDAVIIFDTGGLRREAQRVLALVVLSNLWTALRRRKQREPGRDHPLVNVYLEEAASIANTDLLSELLAQSRAFDCGVTLSMQFPGQLRETDRAAYDELLNNVSTVVTGNVPADAGLAGRLATADMDAEAVGNRLRALDRGQWLASLPATFDAPEPRPFQLRSRPPPPGYPDGPAPLTDEQTAAFEAELQAIRRRTETDAGLRLAEPGEVHPAADEDPEPSPADLADRRVDSALPYTNRLPDPIWYDRGAHALLCKRCDSRHAPTITGLKRAVACHAALDAIDPDDIPICRLTLKLTPEERAAADWTDRQLLFLQAVYMAQQLRFDPYEYDLLQDSMLRLQEYVAIESEAVRALIEAGLLRQGTDHPHRFYTVTPAGREVIGEDHRQGVDYGHGLGDLEESAEHVFMVEVVRRALEHPEVEFVDTELHEIVPYYDLDDQRRLDLAGLDADGNIRVAVEAERVNNDALRAVPDDFDKLAACEPDAAIWVVMSRGSAHAVLDVLNDPPDGEPRVEATYSENSPPYRLTIDTPGLTDIATVERFRKQLPLDRSRDP